MELEQRDALARAKIPGPETGIEIRHTMCDICTPGPQCGVDAYVKDGVIVKLEGTPGFPTNNGALCVRGAAGRQYLYREDRIRTPMRRTGPRGEGKFEPISWEEAARAIARGLNQAKVQYGPESVVFLTGYPKWYRPWLHRLAHSFGSPNYVTESSACHRAEVMSWELTYGSMMRPDLGGMPEVLVGWGCNPLVSAFPMGRSYLKYKERGGKIVIIDPRLTPTAVRCADLYLRPRVGTDGYLANTVARLIIENGWADLEFITRHVHGYEEYRDMVMGYTVEEAVRITGVPEEKIRELARLIGTAGTAVVQPSNGLTHHINGFQTHRAVISLNALTGNVAKPGTLRPASETFCDMVAGFDTGEEEFIQERFPQGAKPKIGSGPFPLWSEVIPEAQGMDLIRQCETEDPYPIRAIYAHGVNHRMYPESSRLLEAAKNMDFVVAADIFWTDFCRCADIVLPACTSFERGEVKCYGGGYVNYTSPAIPPLYQSRDDVDIITMVANALELDDPLLRSGYYACVKHIFRAVPVDLEAVREQGTPVKIPVTPGRGYFDRPLHTPSGRIELYSSRTARYTASHGLCPLPVFSAGDGAGDPEEFPMTLISGGRLPHVLHSRLHTVPWLRGMRPEASADLNPEDAARLRIAQGDEILVTTVAGTVRVKANLTRVSAPGEVNLYHGYEEADVNGIIPLNHLDPYSGFPGYKQLRCRVEKAGESS